MSEIAPKQPKHSEFNPILVERGKRLRKIREGMLDMTMKEFAILCDSGTSTIGQWEQGRFSGLSPKSAVTVIEALKKTPVECSIEWLLHGKEPGPYLRAEGPPLVKDVPSPEEITAPNFFETIPALRNADSKILMHQIEDDAMSPFYKKGDCIGGVIVPASEEQIGEICIVQTIEGEILIRKIEGRSPSGKFRLVALNSNTTIEQITLETEIIKIAVICWFWRLPK